MKKRDKTKQKRGQVSIEYLAVYGFAIAIIIGTVATFSYISSNPEDKIPNDCKFGTEISCKDQEIVSNNLTTIYLYNKEKTMYDITLFCDFKNHIEKTAIPITKIDKGELFEITCPSDIRINSGDKVKMDLKLEYNLNLTSMKNPRYYHGTLLGKAK